jgi:uncharacterized protein (TIGR02265 family)
MSADFEIPRFEGPLDLPDRLACLPDHVKIKGMFFQTMIGAAEKRSNSRPGRRRYRAFLDYPVPEFLEVAAESASLAYPEASPKEGVRRLGQLQFSTFLDSHIGKVVMSFGRDFERALSLVPKAYSLAGAGASAELLEFSQGRAVVALRDVWDFPDVHEVGVWEGVLQAFKKSGRVLVRVLSMGDVDLMLQWTDDAE